MSIWKAYKIWEAKKADSDFERIKINSSGSFYMKSNDLFEDKEKVKRFVSEINKSLDSFNKLNSGQAKARKTY